jgi:DinB family protein
MASDRRYPIGRFTFDPKPTAEKRRAAIAAIGALPAEAKAAARAARLDQPYRDGGWTGRQVVHHLADSHMNAFVRFRLALTEAEPTVKPYDEAKWAELEDSRREDPATSLQILEGLHRRWRTLLESLRETDWTRTARHPEHGVIDLDWLLQMYAWHGRHHVGHLALTAAGGSGDSQE